MLGPRSGRVRAVEAAPVLPDRRPTHVGVVMDGNRRWARRAGLASTSAGHDRGAEHLRDFLGWCADARIGHVSVFVLSADNIRKRSPREVAHLFDLVVRVLPDLVVEAGRWSLHVTGDRALLPDDARAALEDAERATAGRPDHLTLAVAYDGRDDIVRGIRSALLEHRVPPEQDQIGSALGGGPVKEIDLVIRTGGEQRLSGFFPWQTAHAEVVVSERMWPDFAHADFVAALQHFAAAYDRT